VKEKKEKAPLGDEGGGRDAEELLDLQEKTTLMGKHNFGQREVVIKK